RFESRVLEVEVNPKLCAQVGMPIRDHVDPFDRRDLLDILQALERLDRRAYNGVLVGPRRVFGGVASAVAVVSRVRPLAGDTPVSDRRILRQADDRARLFGVFHLGHLDAHDALPECLGLDARMTCGSERWPRHSWPGTSSPDLRSFPCRTPRVRGRSRSNRSLPPR